MNIQSSDFLPSKKLTTYLNPCKLELYGGKHKGLTSNIDIYRYIKYRQNWINFACVRCIHLYLNT